MSRSFVRRLAAGAALVALFTFPGTAGATITGGCTGTGTATSGGVDLTTATEWHVRKDDVGGGTGQSLSKVKAASVSAYALGIGIPIASGTSEEGETEGSVSGVSVSMFAALGARFTVAGSADNGCAGQIEIIIDDVNPLFTLLGGGGIAVALVALLVVLLMTRGGSGIFKRLFDALFGAIGGIGAALALEQFGVIDPTQPIGLIIVIIAAAIAFLTTGIFGGSSEPEPGEGDWSGGLRVSGSARPDPTDTQRVGTASQSDEVLPPGAVGGGGPM